MLKAGCGKVEHRGQHPLAGSSVKENNWQAPLTQSLVLSRWVRKSVALSCPTGRKQEAWSITLARKGLYLDTVPLQHLLL
jgi:hypothetical protein